MIINLFWTCDCATWVRLHNRDKGENENTINIGRTGERFYGIFQYRIKRLTDEHSFPPEYYQCKFRVPISQKCEKNKSGNKMKWKKNNNKNAAFKTACEVNKIFYLQANPGKLYHCLWQGMRVLVMRCREALYRVMGTCTIAWNCSSNLWRGWVPASTNLNNELGSWHVRRV